MVTGKVLVNETASLQETKVHRGDDWLRCLFSSRFFFLSAQSSVQLFSDARTECSRQCVLAFLLSGSSFQNDCSLFTSLLFLVQTLRCNNHVMQRLPVCAVCLLLCIC